MSRNFKEENIGVGSKRKGISKSRSASNKKKQKTKDQKTKKWTCYLLWSSQRERTYIGVTVDAKRRVREHRGHGSRGARSVKGGNFCPVVLVSGFQKPIHAKQFEMAWKKSAKQVKVKEQLVRNDIKIFKPELAEQIPQERLTQPGNSLYTYVNGLLLLLFARRWTKRSPVIDPHDETKSASYPLQVLWLTASQPKLAEVFESFAWPKFLRYCGLPRHVSHLEFENETQLNQYLADETIQTTCTATTTKEK